MSRRQEDVNRRLLRARDTMDRGYADRLAVPVLAAAAAMSPAHFSREFTQVFGETPHRYLQRRRIERAMFLLRTGPSPVTDVSLAVGFSSLGTFSRTFAAVVGCSPSSYRLEVERHPGTGPTSFGMRWTRPSSFGEADGERAS